MDFIDKLEKFLLKPIVKVSYNDLEDGTRIFRLGCYRRSKYYTNILENDEKKDVIKSLIKKLRDNNYKDPKYNNFSLSLKESEYSNDILKLAPTNEDLFNLYKVTGTNGGNNLEIFLNLMEDKDWKLKYFKHGHNYKLDWNGRNKIRKLVGKLKDLNLNDDEWVDALSNHINNSIGLAEKESKEELVQISIECIKDNRRCEKFIKEFFNTDIEISNLFVENKVNKLQIDSKNILRYFDYINETQVNSSFIALYQMIKFNIKEITHTTQIDYYSRGTEHNFIIYDDHENKGIEVVKLLINEMMPLLKNADLRSKEVMKELNNYFVKKLSYINLNLNMRTNHVNHPDLKVAASWLSSSNKLKL